LELHLQRREESNAILFSQLLQYVNMHTTTDATLKVQVAKTSKLSSRVAKIVEMLVSGPVKKTSAQQIVQVEFGFSLAAWAAETV